MSKPHILVFPFPAQGHLLPLLDLTHNLAQKGFTITIIITPKNLQILKPLLTTHPTTIQTLILPLPPNPKIPPGAENVREIGNAGNYPFMNALSKLHNPIIHWFNSHPNPPVAIISDFFIGSAHQLATQLGIKRIAFYGIAAFLIAVNDRCWRKHLHLPPQTVALEFPGLPGTPSFPREHLPSIFLRYKESDPDAETVRECFVSENPASWASVVNTFRTLEGPYLDYIRAEWDNPRVFAVGPLNVNRVEQGPDTGPDGVMKWLDQWEEEGSVLYVCFGSQKVLSKEQMESLAFGLERSMIRFVWVVKEGCGPVPDGFSDRVSDRGLLVRSWAPQVAVLGHRAVGGFLSHCGWNSVLEAMVAGVMILGWPMEADQFVNAKLMAEDIGVAVRVCEGADSVPDPDELARAIAGSMVLNSTQKVKAKALREEAVMAVGNNGQSSMELDELVEALVKLGEKKE